MLESKLRVDGITKYIEPQDFCFDNSFNENESSEELYKYSIGPIINSLGSNGFITVFAYGQTGSGKTYTMTNLLKRISEDLYKNVVSKDNALIVDVSFYEIYSGRCFDLLNNKQKLSIMEDGAGLVNIPNLKEIQADTPSALLQIINGAFDSRTTHCTISNDTSSRSHAICQLLIKNGTKIIGKLNVIDLAGSERAQDTQSNNRQRRFEGAEINKSLLALKECIRAMETKSNHIPFRASKLTLALRDSFYNKGFYSKIIMIACVCPGSSSTDHSINTLRYADRLKVKNKADIANIIANKKKVIDNDSKENNEILKKPKMPPSPTAKPKNLIKESKAKHDRIKSSVNNNKSPKNKPRNNSSKKGDKSGNNNKYKLPVIQNNPSQIRQNNVITEIESNSFNNSKNSKDSLLKDKKNNKKLVKEDLNFMRTTIKRDERGNEEVNEKVFDLHEKVDDIIDQQDELLMLHINILREEANFLTRETDIISKIQNNDDFENGYSIDDYLSDMEDIIKKKIYLYNKYNKKKNKIKSALNEEEEINKNVNKPLYY